MNDKRIRSIATRLALAGGIAAGGTALVPGIADAGCTGKVITASANRQTLHGTACNDEFRLLGYHQVTVFAGGGDDYVLAGTSNADTSHFGAILFLEGGNDRVIQTGAMNKRVWVDGGTGDDIVYGSPGKDLFAGGPGYDTFYWSKPGDPYSSVEAFL